MAQYFHIHSENPQMRLIHQAVEMVRSGSVIVYPTDTGYALGCHLGDKNALERICRIRQLDRKHHFTLVCRDLTEISIYARFDTPVYRLLKANTPGAYTFLLRATRDVPKRLMHPKKKTIGLRIPGSTILHALLEELNEPMLTTTLILPGETEPMQDPEEIGQSLKKGVDLVIDGGQGGLIPTTLIDLTEDSPIILREGLGPLEPFQ
ncbi:threonylcarbamoyl-AMP synthase [bacterium]|nr:threonylcarbamoyl-AMP synthase [bacterium]